MTDSLLDIWSMRKRGKIDSARQKERIKKAIKENLRDLVTDASIISSDGKKKIKIPIRYLDSYRFKHGDNKNQERTGQGDKDHQPGDAIAHDGTGMPGNSKAGDQDGEDVYEEEISVSELVDMMMEDMNLPWLEQKDNMVEVETENIKFTDISDMGLLSNVDKKKTILENMKRNAKLGEPRIYKISNDDLRYKVWEIEKEYHSSAVIFFLMDRSGSMDEEKRYIAKAFFFYLAHFCRTKYDKVEMVFIAHDTTAKIVPEQDFFKISGSGGTVVSSAFKLALEEIEANYPKNAWNTFVFSFSDGDTFGDDNKECIKIVNQLLDQVTAIGYGEISIDGGYGSWSTLHDDFSKEISHPRFMTAKIKKKEDVYECLKQFLGLKEETK